MKLKLDEKKESFYLSNLSSGDELAVDRPPEPIRPRDRFIRIPNLDIQPPVAVVPALLIRSMPLSVPPPPPPPPIHPIRSSFSLPASQSAAFFLSVLQKMGRSQIILQLQKKLFFQKYFNT